jgi:hypothetical protein
MPIEEVEEFQQIFFGQFDAHFREELCKLIESEARVAIYV